MHVELLVILLVAIVVVVAVLVLLRVAPWSHKEVTSNKPEPVSKKRKVRYSSYSARGGREYNEDAIAVRRADEQGKRGMCAVLADGLGGHGGGDVASRTAADLIVNAWVPGMGEEDMRSIFEQANKAVRDLHATEHDMRTTATAITICRQQVVWANAGDSRLYHFQKGKLAWQTTDHSVSQMAVMLGQIEADEIRSSEDRARLLKALGQDGDLNPDVGTLTMGDGEHAFLLCSDGFWEYVLESDMEATLRMSRSPSDWLRRMREIHTQKRSDDCDNNSAMAIWVNE